MIWVLHTFSRMLAALPFAAALRLGSAIGWFLGNVIRHRRRDAAEALALSLPELSPEEREGILNRMYRNLGKTVIEQLRASIKGLDDFIDRMDVHGMEHLKAATDQDAGVITLMAHLGNWELGGFVSRLTPHRLSAVVKPMRNPKFDRYLTHTRKKIGLNILPAATSYRECIKVIWRKEFLGMILDQNTKRSRGVFVQFFGRPACTTSGLAILATQTKAPILPLTILRGDDGRYSLTFLPPLPPPADRKPDTLRDATQLYTRIIEDTIREHPDQWIWIHRRWRTQPQPGDL